MDNTYKTFKHLRIDLFHEGGSKAGGSKAGGAGFVFDEATFEIAIRGFLEMGATQAAEETASVLASVRAQEVMHSRELDSIKLRAERLGEVWYAFVQRYEDGGPEKLAEALGDHAMMAPLPYRDPAKRVEEEHIQDLQSCLERLRSTERSQARHITKLNTEIRKLQTDLGSERETLVAWLNMRIKQQKQFFDTDSGSDETKTPIRFELSLLDRHKEIVLHGKHRPDHSLLGD